MQYICEIDWNNTLEWIQVIGVIVASICLVKTLLLQQETLKEQQKISRLEYQKYINGYLPILEVSSILYNRISQTREIKFDVTIKENYLQALKITHNFPEDYEIIIPHFISDVILPKRYKFNFEIKFVLADVWIEIEEYSGNTIVFDFQDALGNQYQQHLVYKGGDNLFLHPAVRI